MVENRRKVKCFLTSLKVIEKVELLEFGAEKRIFWRTVTKLSENSEGNEKKSIQKGIKHSEIGL